MIDYYRIRFVTEEGFISSAIRGFTNSQWSHAEIVLPDGSYLGALADGVRIRPADYCKTTNERRYAVPVESDALAQMMAFAHEQVGKPYDLFDIAGLATHRNWHEDSAWICSELVAATAEAGGLFMLNVDPEFVYHITPEMLHLSPMLIGHCYFSKS
jgi:uncharacterized protein YycO